MSNSCCDQADVLGRVEARLRQRGEDLVLVAEAPVADVLALEVGGRRDVGVGLNDTCSVPERWKIWAMLTMLAPASRVASALGTQAMAKSTSPLASCSCGTMSTPALDQRHVEALVLVVALVLRREVAGELRLGQPLQLQLDRVGGGRSRPAPRCRPTSSRCRPRSVSVPPSVVAVVSSLAAVVVAAAPAVVADAAVVALPLSSSSPQAATISVKTASAGDDRGRPPSGTAPHVAPHVVPPPGLAPLWCVVMLSNRMETR